MKKYRITIIKQYPITLNRLQNISEYDITAESVDEAFQKAYKLAKNQRNCSISVMEVPEGPSSIGLEIEYEDKIFKRIFTGTVIIRANNEKEAVEYYNKYLKGGRFWFQPGKTEADGKCVRGRVKSTYYAACDGWDVDATIMQQEEAQE